MESTCDITRSTPADPAVDPETGVLNPPVVVVVYSGKCRVRFPYVRPEQILADGQQLAKNRGILWVPVAGTGGVRADDEAVLTGSVLDPDSVGMRFRVAAPFAETHATSRRLPVEVVS